MRYFLKGVIPTLVLLFIVVVLTVGCAIAVISVIHIFILSPLTAVAGILLGVFIWVCYWVGKALSGSTE